MSTEFTLNVITIVLYFSDKVVTDKNYKETIGWYDYRRGRLIEGIIPKAIKLVDEVKILDVTPFSVVAEVPSEHEEKVYTVKVFLNVETPLIDYECECKWGQYRLRPCKHVMATILAVLKRGGFKDSKFLRTTSVTGNTTSCTKTTKCRLF